MASLPRIDIGLLILRIGLGGMMVTHGYPKLEQGRELWEELGKAMLQLGVDFAPEAWGLAASLAEGLGGVLIAIGLFTRISSFALVFTMGVAAYQHIQLDGFHPAAHAIELGVAFCSLWVMGPGRYSLDAEVMGKKG